MKYTVIDCKREVGEKKEKKKDAEMIQVEVLEGTSLSLLNACRSNHPTVVAKYLPRY
jgi:hypothetical protein